MKNITDYKGANTSIHCKTQEQWDKITELLGYRWNDGKWSVHKEDSCIKTSCKEYGSASTHISLGYTIIPASNFIPHRTIEQIETELEVLRNELAIQKAESRPKKKIEFVKKLDGVDMWDPAYKPSDFKNVDLLYKDCGGYDILSAWDLDKSKAFIYLGHFNDGII